jgi:hypothetical protein
MAELRGSSVRVRLEPSRTEKSTFPVEVTRIKVDAPVLRPDEPLQARPVF